MKGLEEWLASSSSASEASSNAGAAAVPRAQGGHGGDVAGVTDARARQAEMRERMRNLLGESVVKAVVAETSAAGELSAPQSIQTAEKNPVEEGGSRAESGWGGDRQQNSSGKNSGGGTNGRTPPFPPEYRRVEVMVVDRGTQTTSTVGCQTDPVEDYAPRIGYPLVSHCTCSCRSRCPCERMLREESVGEETPLRFKEQLDLIRDSIDMLIARYNLPPPPLPRAQ
ncbi:uncharacterized protein Tco025E_08432 [Trypanosoma conorhini]|uniref:Uncharacterized protein n=1 Tax=Trypanosoma conorhini TaxID=83891 RepID=A0A422N9W8_9TRYP|nr:uncharacterized protein Tco025E_08432 [Trypanosoma conorhini]RNF02216.1 hypothetical protein Tco025E_08432 [Trypanosoma conorhini]